LDLPGVIFDQLQGLLDQVLPSGLSLGLWGVLAAYLSMWIYGRLSKQELLTELKPRQKAAREELALYDGPFDGLFPLIRTNLTLSARHMWLTLFPAVLASIPLLFMLAWLSNSYGSYFPAPGSRVAVQVDSYTPFCLRWKPEKGVEQTGKGRWMLPWPEAGKKLRLVEPDGTFVLELPPEQPSPILHKRQWWNSLIANPAGYIETDNSVETLMLGLPEKEIVPFGPVWMRGWLPLFLLYLVGFSLFFKWRWRLQ
jgi:hypothetical protein